MTRSVSLSIISFCTNYFDSVYVNNSLLICIKTVPWECEEEIVRSVRSLTTCAES